MRESVRLPFKPLYEVLELSTFEEMRVRSKKTIYVSMKGVWAFVYNSITVKFLGPHENRNQKQYLPGTIILIIQINMHINHNFPQDFGYSLLSYRPFSLYSIDQGTHHMIFFLSSLILKYVLHALFKLNFGQWPLQLHFAQNVPYFLDAHLGNAQSKSKRLI